MKNLFLKDNRRRLLFQLISIKRQTLKSIFNDLNLPQKLRLKAYFKLKSLNKNSSICRIKNRCILTNRPRSIYKRFFLSRLSFREMAVKGNLIGIKKSSW